MAIITVNDLNHLFNQTVVDLMGKGYVISQFTQGGSYSNTEGHLDMIKPNDRLHIIRIWAVTGMDDTNDRIYRHIDTVAIRVSKYTLKDGFDGKCRSQTLWPDRGEVLSERKFYQICDRSERKGGKVYTDNLDEAVKIMNMQWNRYCSRSKTGSNYTRDIEISKLPATFVDCIMRRINSIRGFKRATASCINRVHIGRNYNGKMAADVYYSQNGKSGIINLR
jgi:hypothetical protein